MSRIAVAIISWNTRELLQACLRSVVAEGPGEVVVVDNSSGDGSPEMVRRDYPGVGLQANDDNPGFGAAGNQAFRLTSAPYLLLLNADTRIAPGALAAITEYLDGNPRVGVLGPRLVHPDGRLQSSCSSFPNPLVPLVKSKRLTRLVRRIPVARDWMLDTWQHDRARRVPWVVGAALALRREAFEGVGGFDEKIRMYFEEPDLCLRLLRAGWETHFAPVTDIVHIEGASTQQRRHDMLWEWAVSYRYYIERHFSGYRLAMARNTFRVGMRVRWARERLRWLLSDDPAHRDALSADAAIWSRALTLGRK